MDTSVRDLLVDRERRFGGRKPAAVIVSLILHLGIAASVLLVPALAAREHAPFEYNRVQIVPLKALGVPDPAPRVEPRAPEPAPPPAEPPEPTKPPASEEKKPVPSPDAEPRKKTGPPSPPSPSPSRDAGADRPAQRRGAADGNPLGLAPFGSNQSGFDDPDFQYSYYTDRLLAIIGSHYLRPAIRTEVELVVHFRVARDGTIYEAEIVQPSGYASFDQAGLSAVRSSTLPPLPVSYPHDSLGVNLVIR